ncbi:unnamed protein product [Prorocentrum cordatum]|uniref:RNase H type-1 domain-containing protein n=1 Tax=Prorocentrum cordatum TaxID=2364126 RepID=A0ABN9UHL8_9DINO|nr:unnamed protein product [Polarella glacialis]
MLETIAVAGIWTRERRRAANLNQEGDDTCARCGEAIETEEHRYYACPANAEIGHSSDTDLAKKAKDALDQRQCLHFWLRGIPPAAWAAKVDPDEDAAKAAQIFCTSEEAQAAAQSGYKVRADYVFTDGSGGAGETAKDPRLRRCGWAVVAFRFDEQGRPQEVAAWYGTIRAPHTVPRAELTAMSKAIGYTTAATARGLNIVSDCKYALDALKQIQDPEDLDYRSTNYDLWLQTKQQLQNSTDTIMGHHIPSHLIEHPAELERWNGPTWWVIGNEMADKYAGWGAEHGALDPAIIAQQQIRDHITGQSIRDWLAETGECLGKYGGHQDQHGNVRLDFKAVQIGTQVVHVSHKTQFTHGWLWCEKCGGTSYLGDHKSRIVAGVARKLARPCQPPTAAGRRVLADTQRGKLPRGAKPAADPADEGLNEITMPGDFKLGLSNHEAIDLDGGSSEAGDPQPAPQQPPSHPYSVVHASWSLVDHMEGYAEQWMNMVDQEVWDDMDDWMEHCVPYLLAITNVGGGTDTQEQTRAVTVQELQQIKDFCEEVWRNTHRTRRRLMTRMLTLPYGTRQQAARVHMDAFQNRRNNILAHSIPSSERRPLPRTAEASREWSPENLDDDDSTPDSEAPELEGEPSNQEMETMAGPEQRHDANSLMQTAVQVAVTLTKPVGPDLMKFVSEADEAGLLHPRLRHNKGEADQDPEQEVAWLERNRLEQLMQSLAGCWSQKEGEQGWPSRQAACVPHVLRALQTGVYQRLFSNVSGPSRQRSQRRAAEEICRLARLNSGEARRQIQQQDPKEAERRRAMAEQFLGVTEPVVRSRRRSTMDMADLDHFFEEEFSEDCLQQPVDKQDSDDNHQQIPDVQHSIGYHLADRRGHKTAQPETTADYDDTDLQRDLEKFFGDFPQRGEGLDRMEPLRGEGLGHGNPQRGEGLGRSAKGNQRLEAEVPDEPSEHDADLLTNSVVDRPGNGKEPARPQPRGCQDAIPMRPVVILSGDSSKFFLVIKAEAGWDILGALVLEPLLRVSGSRMAEGRALWGEAVLVFLGLSTARRPPQGAARRMASALGPAPGAPPTAAAPAGAPLPADPGPRSAPVVREVIVERPVVVDERSVYPVNVHVRRLSGPPQVTVRGVVQDQLLRDMQKYEIPIPSPLDELPEDSLPAFPYHDPAMGCEFRLHQPSRDFLDYAFSQVQPDQRPPLQVLHERHRWQEAWESEEGRSSTAVSTIVLKLARLRRFFWAHLVTAGRAAAVQGLERLLAATSVDPLAGLFL